MNTVGEKIRIQRVIRNYTQEYMAFELSISQAAYSKIERGEVEITLIRIYEIAEVFQISPFELMPKPRNGFAVNLLVLNRWLIKIANWFNPQKPDLPHLV